MSVPDLEGMQKKIAELLVPMIDEYYREKFIKGWYILGLYTCIHQSSLDIKQIADSLTSESVVKNRAKSLTSQKRPNREFWEVSYKLGYKDRNLSLVP